MCGGWSILEGCDWDIELDDNCITSLTGIYKWMLWNENEPEIVAECKKDVVLILQILIIVYVAGQHTNQRRDVTFYVNPFSKW